MKIEQITKMIRELINILKLISNCIYLYHPITLDIRYFYHLRVSGIHNINPWSSRKEWEENIKDCCQYTLWKVIKLLLTDEWTRHNLIAILQTEVERITNED